MAYARRRHEQREDQQDQCKSLALNELWLLDELLRLLNELILLHKLILLDELLRLLDKLLVVDDDAPALVLCPEQLRVFPPQLIVLGNLSRRHRQVGCLRLEATLVGHIVDTVGVAVITDVLVAALLLQTAGLGLGTRLNTANLLCLEKVDE